MDGATISLVDNGSTDGSPTAIAARFPKAKLYALTENRGFTGGIAAALRGSTARNVMFLNNDAVPEKGWLAAMTRAIDGSPDDVVSIGGKIVDLAGQNIDFIGGLITFDGHALQEGFRYPLGSRTEPEAGAEILFACGGNMISRREPLMRLGGFDDDYFAYLEDVDFGWRTWIAGMRVVYEPRAVVRHASAATSERLGNFERGVLFERNALQTVLKNYEDDVLREVSGSIFYAYLHRLQHYATARNPSAQELTRPAMKNAPARDGLLSKVRRKLFGAPPLAVLDDPLTAMQFRALQWIVSNEAKIAAKRRTVQSLRKRSDLEIFDRFPLHFVPTYPGDEVMMSGPIFRLLRPRVRSADRKLGDIIRT